MTSNCLYDKSECSGVDILPTGMIALLGVLFLLILTPLIFMEVMLLAFYKLGISPFVGILIVIGIFLGSFFNLPIKRYKRKQNLDFFESRLFGLDYRFPRNVIYQTESVIAVNIGGCVIPMIVVIYELVRLTYHGVFIAPFIAIIINICACFFLSRTIPGEGIVLPAFVPGLLAAVCGLVLYPENSPAVAFCAGVLGPLVGADLLKLQTFITRGSGLASIGGAGSFDGIVISGIVAILLS